MKRLLTLVAALGLLFSVTAAPVSASAYRPTAQPTIQSNYAGYTNCASAELISPSYHTGKDLPYNSAWIRDGISAHIDAPSGLFRPCYDSTGTDVVGFSSAWVAFTGTGSSNQIVQVGVAACDDSIFAECDYDSNGKWYSFWAVGGCGISTPGPHFVEEVPRETAYHVEVYDDHAGNFVMVFLRDDNGSGWTNTISKSNGAISCWTGAWGLEWMGERKDKADGLGSALYPTYFNSLMTHHAGTWASTTFGPGGCGTADSPAGYPSRCTISGGDTMSIYTGS